MCRAVRRRWVCCGRYLLTERIANLESRITRRDEEITHLKAGHKAPEFEPSVMPIVGTTAVFPSEPLTSHWRVAERKENLHVR